MFGDCSFYVMGPLHEMVSLTMWRMHHVWRHSNGSSRPTCLSYDCHDWLFELVYSSLTFSLVTMQINLLLLFICNILPVEDLCANCELISIFPKVFFISKIFPIQCFWENILYLFACSGIPLVYELDADLKPIRHYYLASDEEVKAAIDKVAAQGKAK